MGVVYKARQLSLKRLVALKMVLHGPHAGDETLLRFRAEAEAVARLQHPNIVAIHEIGEWDGRPFFCLEYVDGGCLADQVKDQPLSPRRAAELVESLARAVHHAHLRGIIHRDLKPGNVLLTADGTPKIADFGLAKFDPNFAGDADGGGSHKTATNALIGTPSYMAPEQAGGHTRQIGPAVDVYALGAILYELLTGRPPFRGATALQTLEWVKHRQPTPPTRLRPKIHRDLETICLKALAKEPERRYASALALAEDLARFNAGEPILGRREGPVSRAWRFLRRNPLSAALAAGVVVAAVALAYFALDARRAREVTRLTRTLEAGLKPEAWTEAHLAAMDEAAARLAELAPEQAAAARQDLSRALAAAIRAELAAPTISADQVARLEGLLDLLARRDAEQGRALREVLAGRVAVPEVAINLTAPFDRLGEVFAPSQAGVDAGRTALVLKGPPKPGALTSRAVCRGTVQAEAVFAAGGWEAATELGLVLNDNLWHGQEIFCLAVSPDGSTAASGDKGGLVKLWDPRTGTVRESWAAHDGRPVNAVAFSPDGALLATAGGNGVVHVWDTDRGRLRRSFHAAGGKGVMAVAFSPSGRLLAFAGADSAVTLCDPQTGAERGVLKGHEGDVWALAFGPTDEVLASAGDDRAIRLWDVAAGRPRLTLAGHTAAVHGLAFAPDGSWLASAGKDETVRLWNPAGGAPLRTLVGPRDTVQALAVSPDGRLLAAASEDHTVWLYDPEGGRRQARLSGHSGWVSGVAFLADGRRLLSTAGDQTARVWDPATGSTVMELFAQRYTFSVGLEPRQGSAGGAAPAGLGRPADGWAVVAQVRRNHVLLRKQEVRLSDGPLHLQATRAGDRLAFRVNGREVLVSYDLLPLHPAGESYFGLLAPGGVRVEKLAATRSALPPAPSAMEQGDAALARGEYAQALEHFQEQARRAVAPAAQQEARCKAGLCLVALGRHEEAVRIFEDLVAKPGDRWPLVAAGQLWRLLLRAGRAAEANALIDSLTTHQFEELARTIPEQDRDAILAEYRPKGVYDFLRHNPHRVRDLTRAAAVEQLLAAPRDRQLQTRLLLVQAYHVEEQIERAVMEAEKLLRDPLVETPGERLELLHEYVWCLRRSPDRPAALEKARLVIDLHLFDSTGRPQRPYRVLYVDRARVHAARGEWDLAEKDLDELMDKDPPPERSSAYLEACLLRGFLRERRGDAAGAMEAWRQGYRATKKTGTFHILYGSILASLSDQLTPKDADEMVDRVIEQLVPQLPLVRLFLNRLFPQEELAVILRTMWQSERGREHARRIAFREASHAESLGVQVQLSAIPACRRGAFGGRTTPEQDEVIWQMATGWFDHFREGRVTNDDMMKIVTTWLGDTGAAGWKGVRDRLPAKLRADMAYIFAHRYALQGKAAEAAQFLETAARDAPPDAAVKPLAERELAELGRRPGPGR
jgi:WD40 repeat protein/tetratricopeptide (TPR) repeat protein